MILDRSIFDAALARHFRPAPGAQQDRWWSSWVALTQQPARLLGFADLLQNGHSQSLHGLAWWEEGPGRTQPSETDLLCAFLSTSTDLDAVPLPFCPAELAGSWVSPEGVRLSLGSEGDYALTAPSEKGSWRIHHSLMDELWIYQPGKHRRALEAVRDGEVLVLRSLSGAPEQRWSRASS